MTSELSSERLSARVAAQTSLRAEQVRAALELLDEGATVPFIARYRKERTGSLDEVQIREINEAIRRLRELESRRASILNALSERELLDETLREELNQADSLTRLEDLYAPHRPRRLTRGQRALEAGLEPLAHAVLDDRPDALKRLSALTSEVYPTPEEVRQGVIDLLAERLADRAEVRETMRRKFERFGRLESKRKRGASDEAMQTYALYERFSAPLRRVRPHQVLALRRGEKEGALSVKLLGEPERWIEELEREYNGASSRANRELLSAAIERAYKHLLRPQLERELRGEAERLADEHAIGVFALNLERLLLTPPMPGRVVLGLDPGLRTGCKFAVVDARGELLESGTVYVHDRRSSQASSRLGEVLTDHDVELIAIGNGTGTREAQGVVAEALKRLGDHARARYAVIDEAGASVYSASDLAREELPGLDISLRGAVSIARRLQDPLAELVKIDPQSIGVGMYQHDVNANRLAEALDGVVEDVVHGVGVDLNTASVALLGRIAGIGPKLAEAITAHRAERGAFVAREALKGVRGLGEKTFEQCAGFLRVREGEEPLDDSGVHPESYALARALRGELKRHGASELAQRVGRGELDALAARHGVGRPTLEDVLAELKRPGRDPREELDAPDLRSALLTLDDIEAGMRLAGTVRNVVDFGAFVDIGVKHDGLVHISRMSERRLSSPHEAVSLGQRVEVTVLEIDRERGRIALAMN